ncbi:hypothetical protein [Streptomyces sp. NPDC058964]|uniref:hypothetical protein n=1 Tax=Streptomyces sp. NPDC058964 TaxID=3346681 RepID=UPI0036762852
MGPGHDPGPSKDLGPDPDTGAGRGPGPADDGAGAGPRPGSGTGPVAGAHTGSGRFGPGWHGSRGRPGAGASGDGGRQAGARAVPGPPRGRAPFQPVTIRTARDAVTAAALYLRWLGYRDIRRADQRPPSGIGLAACGVVAQVDPTIHPASLRDVECLWLTAMTESADCVYFSLAGYADDARARADSLGVPLYVLDLTGTPQPVNGLADDLDATGA